MIRSVRAIQIAFAFGVCLVAPRPVMALGGNSLAMSSWGLSSQMVMVLGTRGSVCSGTVISPHVVVTAAHCVVGSQQLAVAYNEDDSPVLQAIDQVATHPGFSRKASVSIDLALVHLTEALPARFIPVKIDGGEMPQEIGQSVTVAGFGLTEAKNFKSAGTLRSADVMVLPKLLPRFIRLGIDADIETLAICKGDSGGPVFGGLDGGRILIGVIYAAERSGKNRTCGATAQAVRLAPQKSWIDGIMARWNRPASSPR